MPWKQFRMNNNSIRQQQEELKKIYDSCCNRLEEFISKPRDEYIIRNLEKEMGMLFFKLECSAAESHSLFDTNDHEIGKWFADTCKDAMQALVAYLNVMKKTKVILGFCPSEKALASMQSLVKLYLDKKQVEELRKLLSDNSITTSGFDEKRKMRMTKSTEKLISFICSLLFVIAIFIVALFIPNPSGFQYTIFRIILALSAGGFAAFFSGFLTVDFSNKIKAGSGFGVFVIVYILAPAAL